MTPHPAITDEVRELASMYALGVLDAPEAGPFEAHLPECRVCQSEVQAFRDVAGDVAFSTAPARPSPKLRKELLRRTMPSRVLIRADEGVWKPTGYPGVETKVLFVDRLTGAVTSLLRAAAGSVYPAHRHGGLEQCYVIDGDMIFDDHTLDTGDYEANAGETSHSKIRTETGCLAVFVTSGRDKPVG